MKFLIRLYQYLIRFFQGVDKVEIPAEIADDELIIRGIVHPQFYSNSNRKIKEHAFLPPPNGRRDVSVLRHNYTDDNFCKNHAASLKIGDSTYCGLGILLAKVIDEVNSEEYRLENGDQVNIVLKATPDISKDLPMHADIIYSHVLEDDEPKIIMRKIARELRNKSKYLDDPNPTARDWSGPVITKNIFE